MTAAYLSAMFAKAASRIAAAPTTRVKSHDIASRSAVASAATTHLYPSEHASATVAATAPDAVMPANTSVSMSADIRTVCKIDPENALSPYLTTVSLFFGTTAGG